MVRFACRIWIGPSMTPLTAKTTVVGPDRSTQACRLPTPSRACVVTVHTLPPRPPLATAPNPSAPGNDGIVGSNEIFVTPSFGGIAPVVPHANEQKPISISIRRMGEGGILETSDDFIVSPNIAVMDASASVPG